jgi:hypothetical protein
MADLVSGIRLGPFVVFRDENCHRHAVRLGAILAISETDQDLVTIQMTVSRTATVRQAFDRVPAWLR